MSVGCARSKDRARKGINYRMSPENADCLSAAKIDCCVLANNHVLDWGRTGLEQTLATLQKLNIKVAGAGRSRRDRCAQRLGVNLLRLFEAGLEVRDDQRRYALAFGDVPVDVSRDLRHAEEVSTWRS